MNKEYITRIKEQTIREMEFTKKEFEIKKRLQDYQNEHSVMVDGKPEFQTSQEYLNIFNELEKLYFEKYEIQYKDTISRYEMDIASYDKQLEELDKEVVEEKGDTDGQ